MNRTNTIIVGVAALLLSAGAVIVADQQGWLSKKPSNADQPGPSTGASRATTAVAPGRRTPASVDRAVSAEVKPASNVATLTSTPRAQREASVTCANNQKVVDLKTAAVVRDVGIVVEPARETRVTQSIGCNAEIAFNGERLAHVSSRAAGVVHQASAQVGDMVKAGQPLLVIDSMALGGAKAELRQAADMLALRETNLQRLKAIGGNAVTQQELMDAETNMVEARINLSRALQSLRNLGLNEAQIEAVRNQDDSSSLLDVAAPFDGVIIERHAVLGEVIDVTDTLFEIADVSTMWAMFDVRETDARSVHLGQPAMVTLNGLPGEGFAGKIDWIASSIDPTTRTLKARANLDNSNGLLRAHMFGRAQVTITDAERKLVISKDAVQWDGCCNLVFVQQTDTIFQPFKVRLGADLGDHWVVEDGLLAGDQIVMRGGFLLKTEIMKDSIGAGCCEAGGIKQDER